jgi:uncharacterized protein
MLKLRHFPILATLVWLSLSGQVLAQSFNCRYAKTADEVLICQDRDLSTLDERLSSMYFNARGTASSADRARLDRDQSGWLQARKQCGRNKDCIEQTYQRRIQQLASTFTAELPEEFRGKWTRDDGNFGISITATTTFETGYGCDIKTINSIKDTSDANLFVYQVEMLCQADGYQAPPAQLLKSLWAIRRTSAGDALVITTIPDSIEVFQRETNH